MNRLWLTGLALVVGFAAPSPLRADSTASKNNEGNRLYNQKRYEDALKMYTDAQASRPGAPELHYNIGNVLYRKGEFDKAMEEYLKAQAAADPDLAQAATYNRGNALLMEGRLPDAVRAYVQALRAKPADTDAKRNLELALRLLQQQEQKKHESPQQRRDEKDQSKESPPQAAPARPGGDLPKPSRPLGAEMTDEEARQVLEALREEEKEGIRKHARASVPKMNEPEKDW